MAVKSDFQYLQLCRVLYMAGNIFTVACILTISSCNKFSCCKKTLLRSTLCNIKTYLLRGGWGGGGVIHLRTTPAKTCNPTFVVQQVTIFLTWVMLPFAEVRDYANDFGTSVKRVNRLSMADSNLFPRAMQRDTHTFELIHRLNKVRTLL